MRTSDMSKEEMTAHGFRSSFRDWAAETNETLALVLADAWYVEIFDPAWGRNDVLFAAVFEALQAE